MPALPKRSVSRMDRYFAPVVELANGPPALHRATIVNSLLKGMAREACERCLACPLVDDPAGVGIDKES